MGYKTLVIGLGQIGMGYDYVLSEKKYLMTHCQTINAHKAFELIAGFDISRKRRKEFEEKFKKPAYDNLNEIKKKSEIDIIIISVPTKSHLDVITEIFSIFSPKLILMEKPISFTLVETKKIIKISRRMETPLAINYIREFEPAHRKLIQNLNKGILGNPLKIVCWYSNGFINNGSHFIQLLSNFLGNYIKTKLIHRGRIIGESDYEPTIEVIFENGVSYFIPIKEEDFTFFEMEIVGPLGRIKYYDSGSYYELWNIDKNSVLKGYKRLNTGKEVFQTDLIRGQYHVYSNIDDFLKNKSELYCDSTDVLKTASIIDETIEGIKL